MNIFQTSSPEFQLQIAMPVDTKLVSQLGRREFRVRPSGIASGAIHRNSQKSAMKSEGFIDVRMKSSRIRVGGEDAEDEGEYHHDHRHPPQDWPRAPYTSSPHPLS